jgi:tetratricopeptide (TPR) repeat protein
MGKTTTALHVLHHPDVAARYGDRRYFIGCDAVTSADGLASLILQIIRVPSAAGENILTALHRALLSAPLTLLLLDNFETVWDINSRRGGVVDLLQKVVNATSVSLIITMRGTVPPSEVAWTCFGCLPQLPPPDAKKMFLAINPSLSDGGHGDEECLDKLLAEMDYVPLAVRLLAQVSIGFSPPYMLKWWSKEKTAMLHTHEGPPGRLDSVDISISLSLAALDIGNNPDILQLLSMLCQLPDGLHQWEERLPIVTAGFQNIHHLFYLLRKTALIFIAGSTLKVLSPIRHFINRHHSVAPGHIRALENYFWDVVRTHAETLIGPDFPRAKEVLEPDMGNIHSLVKRAAQTHPSHELVEIVLAVSEFQYCTVPSTELLCDVMPLVKQVQSPTQAAWILLHLGDILRMQAKNTEASETLTEAQRQFIKIGDVLGVAQCSKSLGDILYIQAKYTEASEALTKAQRQFIEIGDVLGVAQCSQHLGDILYMQAKYTKASEALTEAQRQFIGIGDVLGVAQCSKSLGQILYMQAKYTEASETLTEAQRQFIEISNVFGVAQCSQSLGNVLCMQAKYTKASEALTEAQRQFIKISDVFGAAQCSQSLGNILCMEAKYTEASEALTLAQRQFIKIGNVLCAAQCTQGLGEILHMQDKYAKASWILTEARGQFITIANVLGVAQCSVSLGNILCMQGQYSEASKTLTVAQSQLNDIGDVFCTARCSIYLGNIFYKQGKYPEASDVLTDARMVFLNIGVALDANDCSRRLGDIYVMQNKLVEAFDTLTEAQRKFLDIGYPLGVTQCSQSLGKILFMQDKYTKASEILTEAQRQFITFDNAVGAAECSTILDDIYCAQAHSV